MLLNAAKPQLIIVIRISSVATLLLADNAHIPNNPGSTSSIPINQVFCLPNRPATLYQIPNAIIPKPKLVIKTAENFSPSPR